MHGIEFLSSGEGERRTLLPFSLFPEEEHADLQEGMEGTGEDPPA